MSVASIPYHLRRSIEQLIDYLIDWREVLTRG